MAAPRPRICQYPMVKRGCCPSSVSSSAVSLFHFGCGGVMFVLFCVVNERVNAFRICFIFFPKGSLGVCLHKFFSLLHSRGCRTHTRALHALQRLVRRPVFVKCSATTQTKLLVLRGPTGPGLRKGD